jgi:predicted aspartyl protease
MIKCGGLAARFLLGLVASLVGLSPLRADDADAPNGDVSFTFAHGNSAVIPCKFILNSLLIQVPTPDKKFVYLLFDTGANAPMISREFAEKMRIRSGGEVPAMGIGQDITVSGVSTGIDFSLGGLTFHGAHWIILPSSTLEANYGLPVVGVLGMDLLKDLVVRIDFPAETIEFRRRSAFQSPAGAVDLPLTPSDEGYLVEATMQSGATSATGHFLIDTGNNGTLELSRRFQDRHPELSFSAFARNGANGVGGTLLTSEAICPALSLGSFSLRDSLVDLDQTAQGVEADIDGIIGNEIWRRFNLVFDLPDNELYLQKNGYFSEPFSYVTAGMNVLASGSRYETLTVHEVLPGSASQRAGFQKGDVLVALEELGAAPLTMANVYPLLHRTGNHHFTVQRGSQKLPLTLELENPLR